MKYLEENFEGDELITRRQQIERGLKMGRDEIIKMTKRYLLKPPVVLLMLAYRKRGSPFLRATLSVLHENSARVPGVTLINDVGDDWGHYIYNVASERPPNEKVWYNLFTQSEENINNLIHFWRQFCLNWAVLTDDLQRLSKVVPFLDDDDSNDTVSPLTIFQGEYPILFECLYAVVGTMMPNSRLCAWDDETWSQIKRTTKQYASNIAYSMAEERRMLDEGSGKTREEKKKANKHQKTKAQQEMLSRQLIEKSAEYAEQVSLELGDDDNIPTVTQVKAVMGRRKQDKENLEKQIAAEDEKSSH
ncbi:LOW QUALITY PROTEIN: hypothetical protein ACHAXR_010421 [Thalassiosira sp. AJA248-18]